MHEIKIPQLGETVEEASITRWHKQEGDRVAAGEPLFSIQTDKAEIECEATAGGVLRKILVPTDVLAPVLTVVALVGEPDEPMPDLAGYGAGIAPAEVKATQAAPAPTAAVAEMAQAEEMPGRMSAEAAAPFVSPRARESAAALKVDPAFAAGTGVGGRVIEADVLARAEQLKSIAITPTARILAEKMGIDITRVQGTGPRGKITRKDIVRAEAARHAEAARPAAASVSPVARAAGAPGAVRRVPLTPMRRIIAERMSDSLFTAPHYYVTVEVDMTAAGEYRKSVTGFKPSYSDLLLVAAAKALKEFPGVNARWAGDAVEVVEDINLGLAVALPAGLIVPVLRQVQSKTLEEIHREAHALVEKARTGKLTPDDYTGNTFTVSNLGVYGVDHFTAIINQPDSAILAIGQIKERPVVINGAIHIRPMMNMTMSSDHRVIDGAVAAQFMGRLKEILEVVAF